MGGGDGACGFRLEGAKRIVGTPFSIEETILSAPRILLRLERMGHDDRTGWILGPAWEQDRQGDGFPNQQKGDERKNTEDSS